MEIDDFTELYQLIYEGRESYPSRSKSILVRKAGLESYSSEQGFKKIAFDSRKFDSESDFNPRRGLQHYNRSEDFISEATSIKLGNLHKLKNVLEDIKADFGKQHEWQDSNCRILLGNLDRGLRVNIDDGGYTADQPGTGSINYIEQLIHARYRLTHDDLNKFAAKEIRSILLSKDEDLIHRDPSRKSLNISKEDVGKQSYDSLIDKLFGNVKASADQKSVSRTVTITITDSFDEKKSE